MKKTLSFLLSFVVIMCSVLCIDISAKADDVSEISSIDINFEVPSVGDEIKRNIVGDIIEYDPMPNVSTAIEGTWINGRYVNTDTIYGEGKSMPDSNRFRGVFENGKEYYIYIQFRCQSADPNQKAYKLLDAVRDNITINGEKPLKVGEVIYYPDTMGKVYKIECIYKFTPKEEEIPELDNVVSVDEIAGTAVVKNEYTGGNDTVDIDIIEQSDIYRMYNPITAEHLYTKDAGEVEYLQAIGWNHESESDYTVIDARDSDAIPVYRLFNPYTDTHHYTESVDEVKYDVSLGWVYERISHYVYHKSSDKGTPQWRLYTSSGPHNCTSDTEEISWLESMGWINEGIRWRVL